MDITKIKLYFEIIQITTIAVFMFYIIPVHVLLGDYQLVVQGVILSALFCFLAWKFNSTLHMLLEKWNKK